MLSANPPAAPSDNPVAKVNVSELDPELIVKFILPGDVPARNILRFPNLSPVEPDATRLNTYSYFVVSMVPPQVG